MAKPKLNMSLQQISQYLQTSGQKAFRCFLKSVEARTWKLQLEGPASEVVLHKPQLLRHSLPAAPLDCEFKAGRIRQLLGTSDQSFASMGLLKPLTGDKNFRILVLQRSQGIPSQPGLKVPLSAHDRMTICGDCAQLIEWGMIPESLADTLAADSRRAADFFETIGNGRAVLGIPNGPRPIGWRLVPECRAVEEEKFNFDLVMNNDNLTREEKGIVRRYWYNVFILLLSSRSTAPLHRIYHRPRDFTLFSFKDSIEFTCLQRLKSGLR